MEKPKEMPKEMVPCLKCGSCRVAIHWSADSAGDIGCYGMCYTCGSTTTHLKQTVNESVTDWNRKNTKVDWTDDKTKIKDLLGIQKSIVDKKSRKINRMILVYLLSLSGEQVSKKDSTKRLLKKLSRINIEKLERVICK